MTAKDGITTKHHLMDLRTGYSYGIKLDAEGNCTAVQLLTTVIQRIDGVETNRFAPGLSGKRDPLTGKLLDEPLMPFGQTTTAIEFSDTGKAQVYTLVWPSEADFNAGAKPQVTKKDLPDNLVRAGLAPLPKAVKNPAGVDDEAALKEALRNIDDMIGLDKAKHDIRQNIAVARFNKAKEELGLPTKPISRHMVFTGNPGTGKTTFAREVAKVYHALGFIEKPEVLEVKREDLVAGFVGQTAIKTKEVIDKAKGGILFIDEAYALSREAGVGDSKDFGREAIDTLVAAMENMREDLIVIVAGYTEPMKRFINANEGLKSRFMTYIEFDDYTLPQLGQILDFMLKDRGYTMDADARAAAMDKLEKEQTRARSDFGNGRTVRNLVEKAEKELALRLESEAVLGQGHAGLSGDDLKRALTTITLKDIQALSLDGISTKEEGISVGFGSRARKQAPANDAPAPAALPEAGAKNRRLGL